MDGPNEDKVLFCFATLTQERVIEVLYYPVNHDSS